MTNKRTHKGAFTLIETIFSTLFLSLTILAIVNLFPGAYLSVRRSETQLQSDMIAKSILEEVRSMPFDSLPSGVLSIASEPFEAKKVDGITYVPKVTIYDVPDTKPTVVRGVKVEVSFRIHTTSRMATYETYIHSFVR